MINKKEAQRLLVEVCGKVISTFAQENNIEKTHLNVRIDLENPTATPVFALFNKSMFVKRCDLNTIIRAGGGKGLGIIVGVYVRDVIKNIFVSAMKEYQMKESKEFFLLLFVKQENELTVPYMSIYKQGEKMDALPVEQLIAIEN
jgi:hypothetical protein